jgi:hypothetical protein
MYAMLGDTRPGALKLSAGSVACACGEIDHELQIKEY